MPSRWHFRTDEKAAYPRLCHQQSPWTEARNRLVASLVSINRASAVLGRFSHQFLPLSDEIGRETAVDRFTPPFCANPVRRDSRELFESLKSRRRLRRCVKSHSPAIQRRVPATRARRARVISRQDHSIPHSALNPFAAKSSSQRSAHRWVLVASIFYRSSLRSHCFDWQLL